MMYKYDEGISVIICCYNSGWIISRCLEALKKQRIPNGIMWEVLLIDNNCTDKTCEIAAKVMQESNIDFSIIKEEKPGLLNARIKGINNARYCYSIFCDDDNLLEKDYVYSAFQIMKSHPDAGAFGGKGIPEFTTKPEPEVMEYLGGYAVGSQISKQYLYGAGITINTGVVKDIYQTQHFYLSGRKGNLLLAGDDTELVIAILVRGYKLYTSDEVLFTHVLAAKRLTFDYLKNMIHGFGISSSILDMYQAVLYGKENALLYVFIQKLGSYFKQCLKKPSLKSELIQIKNKGYFSGLKLLGYSTLRRANQDFLLIKRKLNKGKINNVVINCTELFV